MVLSSEVPVSWECLAHKKHQCFQRNDQYQLFLLLFITGEMQGSLQLHAEPILHIYIKTALHQTLRLSKSLDEYMYDSRTLTERGSLTMQVLRSHLSENSFVSEFLGPPGSCILLPSLRLK